MSKAFSANVIKRVLLIRKCYYYSNQKLPQMAAQVPGVPLQNESYYSGEPPSLDEVRGKLLQYPGGSVTCEKHEDEGLALICINHPDRRNAISGKMMVDFETIVNDLDKWDNGKAILMYGAEDNMFCSGGDLNFVRQVNTMQSGYEMSMFFQKTLHKLSNLPLVSVAYLKGFGALGGGAEITTFCDFRLFDSNPKTRLGFVHNKMGIVPAWGGTAKLVQLVGTHKALNLILAAEPLSYTDAQNIGLADDVVDSLEMAKRWVLQKVNRDKSVIRATKSIVAACSPITEEIKETECRILSSVWGTTANKLALQMNLKHI